MLTNCCEPRRPSCALPPRQKNYRGRANLPLYQARQTSQNARLERSLLKENARLRVFWDKPSYLC